MVRNMARLNSDDIGLCALLMTAFFLVIQVVIGAVMVIVKPGEGILISQGILVFAAGILTVIFTLSNFSLNFACVIRYGRTRREALMGSLGLSALEGLLCLVLATGYSLLERYLFSHLWRVLAGKAAVVITRTGMQWPGALEREQTLLVEDFGFLPWWALPLIILGCLILGLICGTVLLRFGVRGIWFFVGICWLPSICLNLFPELEGMWLQAGIAAGAVALAGIAWSVRFLLHAPIKT